MHDPRKWKDQPACLAESSQIFEYIPLGESGSAQIMLFGDMWYLTVGNLFGSQTVRTNDIATVGTLIHDLALRKGEEVIRLDGYEDVEIVENSKELSDEVS
jgi:hypothetical protein|tara:strand:- start:193 stop:495 length:303 start_codon:yes stop_codon:yes gene_type:complete